MARNVPAGIETAVREKCAGTGDVFFRLHSVDLVFGFVSFIGNGEKADVVNGRVGGTQPGNGEPSVVPGEIHRIGDEKEQCERGGDTQN